MTPPEKSRKLCSSQVRSERKKGALKKEVYLCRRLEIEGAACYEWIIVLGTDRPMKRKLMGKYLSFFHARSSCTSLHFTILLGVQIPIKQWAIYEGWSVNKFKYRVSL